MSDEARAEAYKRLHEAIGGILAEGELAIAWTLTIDVAGPDNVRYLAHRAGGGFDGADAPMAWTALGMLTASANAAADQLREGTVDERRPDDGDD